MKITMKDDKIIRNTFVWKSKIPVDAGGGGFSRLGEGCCGCGCEKVGDFDLLTRGAGLFDPFPLSLAFTARKICEKISHTISRAFRFNRIFMRYPCVVGIFIMKKLSCGVRGL